MTSFDRHTIREYVYLGLTALAVVAASLLLYVCFQHWGKFGELVGKFVGILSPFIYGAVLAYLLSPIYNAVRDFMIALLENSPKKRTTSKTVAFLAKGTATIVALVVLIAAVVGIIMLIIPQLISSVVRIWNALPDYWNNFYNWVSSILENNPDMKQSVTEALESLYDNVTGGAQNTPPDAPRRGIDFSLISSFLSQLSEGGLPDLISQISSSILSILVTFKNWFLGVIVMLYFLNIKETLIAQLKKICYSIFPVRVANELVYEARYVNQVFGGFIVGKIIDSIIIGILCFICISIMKMPYPMLISTIIGVTNVIPFFGPFFGAIPSAFLIFLVSPLKSLYFIIFVLILQQFDGNILGPKILGNSTGLPSFWIMFAILFFGSLFGFVGMIIGVPLLAVIMNLVSRAVHHRLRVRKLPMATADYRDAERIDETTRDVVKKAHRKS